LVPAAKSITFKVLVLEDGLVLLTGVKTKPWTVFPAPELVEVYEKAEASVPAAVVKVCWICPVPDDNTKFWLAPTVRVPLEVNPEVAVINPEIVGVAVQEVPVTVRFPPKDVRLDPETVKVLSKVVAPWRVKAPGVDVDPIVLTEEAPEPNVLVRDEPVPMVEAPEEVKVVNAPDPGVPEPIEPGAAKVAPFKDEALRLATLVVDETTNGAVPVDTVDVI
jgi:hypothetical protein